MLICLKIPGENCSVRQSDWINLTQNHWSSSKHLNIVGFNTVRVEVTLQILLRTETEYTERYWYCQKIHLLCSQWCGGKFKCLTEFFFFLLHISNIYIIVLSSPGGDSWDDSYMTVHYANEQCLKKTCVLWMHLTAVNWLLTVWRPGPVHLVKPGTSSK